MNTMSRNAVQNCWLQSEQAAAGCTYPAPSLPFLPSPLLHQGIRAVERHWSELTSSLLPLLRCQEVQSDATGAHCLK